MIITRGRRADAPYLADVMFQAIRLGATKYTVSERSAWAPRRAPSRRFARRLAKHAVWVARGSKGPVGFMTVDAFGYIDLAYILPAARGKGLFRRLLAHVAMEAEGPLSTHASLHAQGAFARLGFDVVHHEEVLRHGQRLKRAFMQRG